MNKIQKLNHLLKYVKENNPYYKDLYSDITVPITNIERLPILKRSSIRNNKENIISNGYSIDKLKYDRTNGTTEKIPLDIYKTESEWIALDLMLWKERRKINFEASKRYAFYYYNGRDFSEDYRIKEGIGSITIQFPMRKSNNYKFVDDLKLIIEKNIKWLIAPPSLIFRICNIALKYNLKLTLDVVEVISEYLPKSYKKLFEKVFNCKTIIHYSCHEIWGMAFSDEKNKLKIMNDIILEQKQDARFLRDYGPCVVTNLKLKSMPFIRYELSDLINISGNTIKTYGFRTSENIVFKDFKIHCSFIDNIFFNFRNIILAPLENYQIIYDEKTIFFYLIDIPDEIKLKIKKLIQENIFKIFNKQVDIKLIDTNRFFIDKISGKMRGIIDWNDVDWEN